MWRVLVVEDHEGWHRSLIRHIGRAGHAMKGAYTCGRARELIEEERFDLAIIDVHLPDGFGFDLVADFKVRNPRAGVLVASAYYPCEAAAQRAREVGADWFAASTGENLERVLRGEPPECNPSGRRTLEDVKVDYMHSVLLETRGNRTAAAAVLGIKRQSLQQMLRKSTTPRD